jgi:hypothetical protein
MWLHRNYILHEMPSAETKKLQQKLDRRITNEFQKNVDGLSTPHHHLLRRNSLSRILKWSNHEKTAWIDTVIPLPEKLGAVAALKHDDNAEWFVT